MRYHRGICLDGPKKTTKIISQDTVAGPEFEPEDSRARSRSAIHPIVIYVASYLELQIDYKLLSGFPLVGHENPDNNL
jgi:hypothetical protein